MIPLMLSYLNALIFLAVSVFHYYWAFGGRYGFWAALPDVDDGTKAFVPGKIATAIVASLFLAVAIFYARLLPLGHTPYLSGFWMLAAITFLRAVGDFRYVGFFKKKRDGLFATYDSRYYSPLCLYLAISTAGIALFGV